MPEFPSAQWFNAVRSIYNADPTLHSGGGGACDTRAACRIGERVFLLVFEGNECAVGRIKGLAARVQLPRSVPKRNGCWGGHREILRRFVR